MGDPLPGAPPTGTAPDDRLDSWKEIAAFLRRDVTTVQRWEKREAMPVHRHVHDKIGSVYAFRSELNGWARSRNLGVARDGTDAEAGSTLTPEPLATPDAVLPGVEPPSSEASGQTPAARRPLRFAIALIAVAVLVLAATIVWLRSETEYFWRNPIAEAEFQHLTDFDGTEQAAAISRDGRLVAFQSDRDGQMDVWITQVGTGRFYNLTRGRVQDIVNASVRALGFSPDGALVTFWARKTDGSGTGTIGVWALPALGGDPQPYLEGVGEFDWSKDNRLVYHTTGAGDPTFVRTPGQGSKDQPIFTAAAGLHAHFPLWSPDQKFIYFVQGEVPDAMDVWRIRPSGGAAERITTHNSRVSYPVMLNDRTLMYLATSADGSGPWLYAVDVERRVPHRVSSGFDSYTSLSVSADGHRLVLTLASPKGTLWRLPLAPDQPVDASAGTAISLTTGRGFSPRLGPDYLLYVSSKNSSDAIWKLADGTATELWTAPNAHIIGSPEIDPASGRVAFSIEQLGKTMLYVMNDDGTNAHVVTSSLDLRGFPAWASSGQSITSAAMVNGTPHLFTIALDGSVTPLVQDYAMDPIWSRDGNLLVYSGPDIGTTFPVKGMGANNTPYAMPNLTLTRGARRLRFLGHHALVVMRGEIQHKDLWEIDLDNGAERQLTNLPPDFNVRDFDISANGREVVLERVQEAADIVLLDTNGAGSSSSQAP